MEISHDVDRLVRGISLALPLKIGAAGLDQLLVRTRDYGSVATIAEAEQVDPTNDTEEIVVTGKRKESRPSYLVYLGSDYLNLCSSIVYDKIEMIIVLSCKN